MITTTLPILPRSRLYLEWAHEEGADDKTARRFASLFAEVWRRLPLSVRRLLMACFRQFTTPGQGPRRFVDRGLLGSEFVDAYRDAPTKGSRVYIYLLPICYSNDRTPVRGCVSNLGTVVQFSEVFLCLRGVEMPDDVLMNLIAHELAHVQQHATGYFFNLKTFEMLLEGVSLAEEDADRTAERWGFGYRMTKGHWWEAKKKKATK